MQRNIWLDADGVLVDFNGSCERKFGAHPRHLTFDCPENGLLKGDRALWAHVETDPDFWLDMIPFDHAEELVEMCRPYGVQILTGCPATGYDRASAHKKEKLGKLFGVPVITCRSKDKPLHMSSPGDILVDDFVRNVKKWREAGGHAILFKTWEQARAELEEAIANF